MPQMNWILLQPYAVIHLLHLEEVRADIPDFLGGFWGPARKLIGFGYIISTSSARVICLFTIFLHFKNHSFCVFSECCKERKIICF